MESVKLSWLRSGDFFLLKFDLFEEEKERFMKKIIDIFFEEYLSERFRFEWLRRSLNISLRSSWGNVCILFLDDSVGENREL